MAPTSSTSNNYSLSLSLFIYIYMARMNIRLMCSVWIITRPTDLTQGMAEDPAVPVAQLRCLTSKKYGRPEIDR